MAKMDPVEIAAEIVASFVGHNSLPKSELPDLIASIHAAAKKLAEGGTTAAVVVEAPQPAVSIRKSVTPDYLICLEDGKQFKSLRRHLATLGMTPEQYRAKWDLPSNYPMVAPNYAAQRSSLAKSIGLGRSRSKPEGATPTSVETVEAGASASKRGAKAKSKSEPAAAPSDAEAKRKRGRPRKA